MEEQKVIETENGLGNGQEKCPKCGATDISLNIKGGKLRCNFCRYEFEPVKTEGWVEDIKNLTGEVIGSGAKDIDAEYNDMVTLKCTSCGAEVVVDTSESTQARCHWCRNTLSINDQIPNGAVPDVVLPFEIPKNNAKHRIEKFVQKRQFFAHPKFKEEFSLDNVMGVYLPYMIIDINSEAYFNGEGEELIRSYTVGRENRETYYDANLYDIERKFDMTVEGLTVESNSDKLDRKSQKTNNIINSIMPFDISNCVKWNANYLKGFSSEKRDTNINELKPLVEKQARDIARYAINDTLSKYDRGVRWDTQKLEIKGEQWKTAHLPIWLYSYKEEPKNVLHYVAVNARTGETMGSIPVHKPKLFAISFIIEIFAVIISIFLFIAGGMADADEIQLLALLVMTAGFVYYGIMYNKYRNKNARHSHELETKRNISNLKENDKYIKRKNRMKNSKMYGANNTQIEG